MRLVKAYLLPIWESLMLGAGRADLKPYLMPEKAELWPERVYFRPYRANVRIVKAYLMPISSNLSL